MCIALLLVEKDEQNTIEHCEVDEQKIIEDNDNDEQQANEDGEIDERDTYSVRLLSLF